MLERRSPPPRKRVFKTATIAFAGGAAIDAVVKNLSETGALVHVESVIGIPDKFTLYIKGDHFKRECKIAWRLSNRMGVRFL